MLINRLAIPSDRNMIQKEAENKLKHKNQEHKFSEYGT